jgi:hypothetical protein
VRSAAERWRCVAVRFAGGGLTPVPRYRVTLLVRPGPGAGKRINPTSEGVMSASNLPIHSPAPAPDGPIVCTLHPNDFAGRLEDFRQGVFGHLRRMERPEPTRLRLVLAEAAGLETVQDLLIREQQCCAFLAFTIIAFEGQLIADLEVPAEAAAALDGLAQLARLATAGVVVTGEGR